MDLGHSLQLQMLHICIIDFYLFQKVLVDAPVLVDVQHGSVRYRQAQGETQPVKSLKGKEHPYENDEGKDLDNKENYFYHTRLDKYGNGKRNVLVCMFVIKSITCNYIYANQVRFINLIQKNPF